MPLIKKWLKPGLLFFFLAVVVSQAAAQDYFKLGCMAQDKANLDQAIVYYNKKIAEDPKFTKAYINRGLCYQDKAYFDLALNDFKRAIELQPGDPDILMSMGTTYFHLKQYRDALKCLETALKKRPENADGQYDLGMTRHQLRDYRGAIEAFNTAIKLAPDKARFYYSRGLTKDVIRDFKGADADFSEAIRLQPDYEKAWYFKAKEKNELHRYQDALTCLDKVIKMNPSNTRYYAEKADIEFHLGWLAASLEDCRTAIRLNDQYGAPFYTKALAERDSGMMDSARKDMDKANEMFGGKSALAWVQSAGIYLYTGNYKDALKDADAACRLARGFNYALFYKAYAEAYTGADSMALRDIDQMLKNDPDFTRAYWLKGRILLYHFQQKDAAMQAFEKGAATHGDSESLAWCLAFLNKQNEAENILKKLSAEYRNAGLRIQLRDNEAAMAYMYAVTGDTKSCTDYLEKALGHNYSFKSWIEDSEELKNVRKSPEYSHLAANYHLKKSE